MIKINLAPTGGHSGPAFRLRLPSFNVGFLFLVIYVAALGGVGTYWWHLSIEESRLNRDIETMNRELTNLRAITGQGAQVKAQAAELRQRVQVIAELTKNQGRPLRFLDAFVDNVPKDLWITGIEEKGTVLNFKGTAFSTTAVSDFMQNLRASGRFKEVDIVVARQEITKTPRFVTFEVTCRFES
jgi:type IV pilus assembly protein PilN